MEEFKNWQRLLKKRWRQNKNEGVKVLNVFRGMYDFRESANIWKCCRDAAGKGMSSSGYAEQKERRKQD
ncbi:MAG: hypothetical protein ACLTBV_20085 [Enterocloster bolteae]